MSEINIFRNLVKIAYLNPKYRHELFCLLGMSFKQHKFRVADTDAAVKIQEDAKQGIFSGYTLGVLSAFYTNKNRKFKNPNPEGKKEIAMSTLAKYYSERENNPAYKKFEGQTISELQKAFNEFYSEFERQQKTNKELKEKETEEEIDVDELEVKDDDEGQEEEDEGLTTTQKILKKVKRDKEKKIKEQERKQVLLAKNKELYGKLFQTLDEIDPFRDMTPEKEAREVEKLYKTWEEKFFVEKDGKVYLKNTGIEDNEKTRQLVKDVLRDNLTDDKIDEMFNETGIHRHGAIGKFLNPIIDEAVVKSIVKGYTEKLEKHSHLFIKAMSFATTSYENHTGKKIDFENPQFVKDYLDYIDKKYTQQLDPEVRLSMRKNTKALISVLKNLGNKTGAIEYANEITSKAIEKVENSENIQKALTKTKEFTKNLFNGALKSESNMVEQTITSTMRTEFKHKFAEQYGEAVASVTDYDKELISQSILGETGAIIKVFKEKGLELQKEHIQKIVDKIKDDIEVFKSQGTLEALDKVKDQLDALKIEPSEFEDSILSKVGTVADIASQVNDVYEHTVARAARATLNVLEGDISGLKSTFADDFETTLRKKVASSIDNQLNEMGLLKEGISISEEDIEKGFGVDKWIDPLKEKVGVKLDGATDELLNDVRTMNMTANLSLAGLEMPTEAKQKIAETMNSKFNLAQEKIEEVSKKLQGEAKVQFDILAKTLKGDQTDLENKSYTEICSDLHKTLELGKSQIGVLAESTKGLTEEAKKQVLEIENIYKDIEKGIEEQTKFLGAFSSPFMDTLKKAADSHKEQMRNKIGNELNNHLEEVQKQMNDDLTEHTDNLLENAGGVFHGVSSLIGSTVGLPLSIVAKKVTEKITDIPFYSEVEKEGGESAVLHQKLLNHKLLPQEVDDDFRTKAKEIMSSSIPVEEKIEKLRSLQYRYDEEARPIIAKALYQLGKRDANNKDVEGFFKQKWERLKRGSEDEIDFSTFFIRTADTLSDEDKVDLFNNHIRKKKNDTQIPIEILINMQLNKMVYSNELKQGIKKFRDGGSLNSIMDTMTGKKGINQKTYQQTKERHLENIKKKGKKKKK